MPTMARFSQRIGKSPIKTVLQTDSMDDDLRVGLWNTYQQFFAAKYEDRTISDTGFLGFYKVLWRDFLKLPLDELDNWFPRTFKWIREWFFRVEWYEVYDFMEFIGQANAPIHVGAYRDYCNAILEGEMSGYRFVGDLLTPITDDNELQAIQEAIEESVKTNLSGVHEHLRAALSKLSDRKDPDYRNSIKESISAVESLCQVILGDPKATLGKALKVVKDKIGLHTALEQSFSAIYGYASDEGGIRHAMLGKSDCEFEDAKYMLVSCSAFIKYLLVKAAKAGVEF